MQIAPDFDAAEGTLNKVCEAIDKAAAQGVQLIVFPETFLPYYPYFSFVKPPVQMGADHMRLYDRAVVVPGPVTQAVAQRARAHGMVVVLGVNERDFGSLYNTQLIFDADGTLMLKRRKLTPTFHERMVWGQGDAAGLKVVGRAAHHRLAIGSGEVGTGLAGALAGVTAPAYGSDADKHLPPEAVLDDLMFVRLGSDQPQPLPNGVQPVQTYRAVVRPDGRIADQSPAATASIPVMASGAAATTTMRWIFSGVYQEAEDYAYVDVENSTGVVSLSKIQASRSAP